MFDMKSDHSNTTEPTKAQLEILQVLWKNGPSNVRLVNNQLNKQKQAVTYTSTLKLMQIMYEKNLVERDDSSKTHIYTPAVTKEKTQKQFLNRMINNLFAGSSADLVLQALGENNTSDAELSKIQRLIEELKQKK